MSYKGYQLVWDIDQFLIFKIEDLVGSADDEARAEKLVDELISQGVSHESQLK